MKKGNTLTGLLLTMILSIAGPGILTGCDYARIMEIRASGKKNSSVVLYGNKALTGKGAAGDTAKIVIRVPGHDTTSRRFYFGMGTWDDASLDALIGNIDSVMITNHSGTEQLNDKNALKAYFQEHRGGFGHNELILEAK
ncbi:MAG: hypothetical protein J7599_23820 [Niabella sp.]|nr:hypothetical protein [Niabella sp.]